MSHTPALVYEVTLSIEPEIAEEVDAWLDGHVDEVLQLPGFVAAQVYAAADDDGRTLRMARYELETESDLESFLAGPGAEMQRAVTDRFADRLQFRGKVLRASGASGQTGRTDERCLNCNRPLAGQYCASCGQRARTRLISLWELIADAFGDLFELDSRLWRTLIPLFARPGKLTRDYLEGKRARFMPPFRSYLVLSIIFFLVAFFDPKRDFEILFEPEQTPATEPSEPEQVGQDAPKRLDEAGVVISDEERARLEDASSGLNIDLSSGEAEADCDLSDMDMAGMPDWLARRLTPERMQRVCDRINADSSIFLDKLIENVPAALFFLLPLMALVLKMLYPLSKRYYVEHLLFVVHFHAFFFLVLTLQILFARLGTTVGIPETPVDLSTTAVSLYIPIYLYKGMRRVYSQGRFITVLKFLLLTFAYLVGFALVMLVAMIIAAFSV
ncbi:MAG: DUF4286 family protein [Woeseiaceae bacterium]